LITELMYNPPSWQGDDGDFEWIEIANVGVEAVDLSGWEFLNGVTFTFPNGTSIAPDEFIVVAADTDSVMTYYGITNAIGNFSGGFSNSGELIVLADSSGVSVDTVDYDDGSPWPIDGDGYGSSIEVLDIFADNNDPANWAASLVTVGSPGAENQVPGIPVDTTIYGLQYTMDPSGDSPFLGQLVQVGGTVTDDNFVDGGIIVQDNASPWNGIQVLTNGSYPIGQDLTVYGTVTEFYDRTLMVGTIITDDGAGTPLDPVVVTADMINTGGTNTEDYECVLVQVANTAVSNPDAGYGEWEVTDGVNALLVDNGDYTFVPVLGDSLLSLTGTLNYSFNNFKVAPRDDADIEKWYPEGPSALVAESANDGFVPLSWNSPAWPFEGFEEGIPADWTVYNYGADSSGTTWTVTSSDAYEGNQSAFCNYGGSTETQDEWLISPQITIENGVDMLRFYHRAGFNTWDNGPNYILVSTTDTQVGSFTAIDTFTYAAGTLPSAWTEVTVDLSAYAGQSIYLAAQYQSTNGESWFIDAFSITPGTTKKNIIANLIEGKIPEAVRTMNKPIDIPKEKGLIIKNRTSSFKYGSNSKALTQFNVYRSQSPNVAVEPGNLIGAVDLNTFTYTDNNVTNFTNYYYVVTAVWDEGESLPSNEVSGAPYVITTLFENEFAASTPVLDGVISAGEWDDATLTYTTDNGVSGKIYSKNDTSYLYLAFEHSLDMTLDSYDQVGLYFDTNNDGVYAADGSEGNYWLLYDALNDTMLAQFRPWLPDTTVGTVIDDPAGVVGDISIASGYVQYEVRIDLATAHYNPSYGDTAGFRIYIADTGPVGAYTYWPEGAIYNWPSTYGDMVMNPTIPTNDLNLTFEDADDIPMWSHWDEANAWTAETWNDTAGVGGSGALELGDAGWALLAKRPVLATPGTYFDLSIDIKTEGWDNPGTYPLYLIIQGIADPDTVIINSEGAFTTFSLNGMSNNDSGYIRIGSMNTGIASKVWVDNVIYDDDAPPNTIEDVLPTVPMAFDLGQNYPNPFNPTTTIKYQLPEKANVKIVIYNMLGQAVRTVVDKSVETGYHVVKWDGLNETGSRVATGIYFYRMETEKFIKTQKMILMK